MPSTMAQFGVMGEFKTRKIAAQLNSLFYLELEP